MTAQAALSMPAFIHLIFPTLSLNDPSGPCEESSNQDRMSQSGSVQNYNSFIQTRDDMHPQLSLLFPSAVLSTSANPLQYF